MGDVTPDRRRPLLCRLRIHYLVGLKPPYRPEGLYCIRCGVRNG